MEKACFKAKNHPSLRKEMVRPTGFEPVAPRLGIWCSILLSYGRDVLPFMALRPR